MADILGLLDIPEATDCNRDASQQDSGVVLVSHEDCGNLLLATGMRIRCDHGDAKIVHLDERNATVMVLSTGNEATLPIADIVFHSTFEILGSQDL